MTWASLRRFALSCLLALLHAAAFAADEGAVIRDPMRAPAAPMAARSHAGEGAPQSGPAEAIVRHLMVIDGRRYVIEGGQRLGVGDRLGEARIERIDDGAVWLRDARGTRQVSLFGGIGKRPVVEADAASSAALPAPRKSASAASGAPSANGAARDGRRKAPTTAKGTTAVVRSPQVLASVPAATDAKPTDQPGSHPTTR